MPTTRRRSCAAHRRTADYATRHSDIANERLTSPARTSSPFLLSLSRADSRSPSGVSTGYAGNTCIGFSAWPTSSGVGYGVRALTLVGLRCLETCLGSLGRQMSNSKGLPSTAASFSHVRFQRLNWRAEESHAVSIATGAGRDGYMPHVSNGLGPATGRLPGNVSKGSASEPPQRVADRQQSPIKRHRRRILDRRQDSL